MRGIMDRILNCLTVIENSPVPKHADEQAIVSDLETAKAALMELNPAHIEEAHDVKALFDRIDLLARRLRSVRNDLDARELHVDLALELCRQLGAAAEDQQPNEEDDL